MDISWEFTVPRSGHTALTTIAAASSTMTSREIAELTGKEHFNVLIDIRKMLDDLEIDALSFQAMSPDSYGRPKPMFKLPKDLTLSLVSDAPTSLGYSAPLRQRIVTRWM